MAIMGIRCFREGRADRGKDTAYRAFGDLQSFAQPFDGVCK